jgi:hypothetical protein
VTVTRATGVPQLPRDDDDHGLIDSALFDAAKS